MPVLEGTSPVGPGSAAQLRHRRGPAAAAERTGPDPDGAPEHSGRGAAEEAKLPRVLRYGWGLDLIVCGAALAAWSAGLPAGRAMLSRQTVQLALRLGTAACELGRSGPVSAAALRAAPQAQLLCCPLTAQSWFCWRGASSASGAGGMSMVTKRRLHSHEAVRPDGELAT
jgi:hypothetical protein